MPRIPSHIKGKRNCCVMYVLYNMYHEFERMNVHCVVEVVIFVIVLIYNEVR